MADNMEIDIPSDSQPLKPRDRVVRVTIAFFPIHVAFNRNSHSWWLDHCLIRFAFGEGFLWIALLDGLPVLNCFCRFGSNDLFIFCSWMQIVEF